MAYADLLSDETSETQFLCIVKPRRRVSSFTLYSGSVYVASFDYGEVVEAFDGLISLTQGTSSSLSAGEFYYDVDTSQLYVRLSGGGNPNSTWLIATYELYLATYDASHYRVPDDSTTRVVYYEPTITKSPQIKQSTSDSLFGFNPVSTLTMNVGNTEHLYDRHIHDSSFNDASIEIWHWLGDTEDNSPIPIANISKVLKGTVRNVSLDQPTLTISIFDHIDLLSTEWRHPSPSESFYSTSLFANLDPLYKSRPIRLVYGRVDGYLPVNVSYVDDGPTTSDNRNWVVCTGQSGLSDLNFTVTTGSTTTRTNLTAAPNGINVGDTIWIDKAADESTTVTAVGANYLDHDAVSVAALAGDHVKRAFVGSITIVQNNVKYQALYNRDYTIQTFAGNTSGFVFSSSLEANLSMPATLNPTDKVFCRVYGPVNFQTLGGPAFGTDDSRTANMTHPAQFILDVLKNHIGVSESDIDTASFTAALSSVPYGMSLVMPQDSVGGFVDYRTILSDVTKSSFMRLIVGPTGKFTISVYAPMGSATKQLDDDEILEETIGFDYTYDELISDVIIEYDRRETSNNPINEEQVSTVSSTSSVAKYLHKASKSKTERSLWIFETEAQQYADRLAFVLGDRIGKTNLQTKNRFFDSKVGDIILLERAYLPGNTVDGETLFSRKYRVSSIQKGFNNVTLELDDQKGAEDNSGGW